jgi:ElaB/YqjD/DUF883 family membrane-anchored ribosome-binding protein
MDNETEVIKHQMEETRTSLTEKLETLENQVVETVQETTTAVADTVENVKEAVEETVETVKGTVHEAVEAVKETFNLSHQVERHPWPMFGLSVATGYLAGRLLNRATGGGRRRSDRSTKARSPETIPSRQDGNGAAQSRLAALPSSREAGPSGLGWLSGLAGKLAPEINKLKGLAIGALIGGIRDRVVEIVPDQMKPRVKEVLDNVTTKLGGQALPEPIFKTKAESQEQLPSYKESEETMGTFD